MQQCALRNPFEKKIAFENSAMRYKYKFHNNKFFDRMKKLCHGIH